jgi:hypothetical protein
MMRIMNKEKENKEACNLIIILMRWKQRRKSEHE